MKVNGKLTICMVRVFILGKMEENTKVLMNQIKSMVMVYMFGQMVGDMKEIGLMENNMDKENIYYLMVLLKLVSGNMEKDSSG